VKPAAKWEGRHWLGQCGFIEFRFFTSFRMTKGKRILDLQQAFGLGMTRVRILIFWKGIFI